MLHHSLGQDVDELLFGDLGGVEQRTAGLERQEGALVDGLVGELADGLVTNQGTATQGLVGEHSSVVHT